MKVERFTKIRYEYVLSSYCSGHAGTISKWNLDGTAFVCCVKIKEYFSSTVSPLKCDGRQYVKLKLFPCPSQHPRDDWLSFLPIYPVPSREFRVGYASADVRAG